MSHNLIYIYIVVISLNLRVINSNPNPVPQLNLPPLNDQVVHIKPKVTLNSYVTNDDQSNEVTNDQNTAGRSSLSSDYDRDRSERFGPPYNDDNSDRYYLRNRSVFNSRDQYGYQEKDDDRYYADRRPDIINGNLNYNRNGGNNNDDNRYYKDRNNNDGYQRVSYLGNFSTKSNICKCHFSQQPFQNDDDNNDERDREEERFRYEQERQLRIENANLQRFLSDIDQRSSLECSLNVAAQWNFETNVNEVTQVEAVSIYIYHNYG